MALAKYDNPLDNLFDIDQSAAAEVIEYDQTTANEIALAAPGTPEQDADDIANDKRIETVYDMALETFQNQTAMIEMLEPRYAARNAEVAASYLNIALQAAATRARVKNDRKRIGTFIPNAGNKTTNNVVVATRDEIMRLISVDGSTKAI